jgi:hypothetical protein
MNVSSSGDARQVEFCVPAGKILVGAFEVRYLDGS